MLTKILIVDDEPDVRSLVRNSLRYALRDLESFEAADGDEALQVIAEVRPDLMVLDLAMPHRDGLSVLEEVRRRSDLPVIVLTARGLEGDRIRGLELGADDYITKPFSPRELTARVEAVLRRSRPVAARKGTVDRGGLHIDLGRRQVVRAGNEVHLTPTEFRLLAELATSTAALRSEDLLTSVWGPEYQRETHYLKVYVGRLRDKLEDDPARPRLIVTVRGVGYRFTSQGEFDRGR